MAARENSSRAHRKAPRATKGGFASTSFLRFFMDGPFRNATIFEAALLADDTIAAHWCEEALVALDCLPRANISLRSDEYHLFVAAGGLAAMEAALQIPTAWLVSLPAAHYWPKSQRTCQFGNPPRSSCTSTSKSSRRWAALSSSRCSAARTR